MAARKRKSAQSKPPSKAPSRTTTGSPSNRKRTRRRYSDAERQRILETARREGLSGPKAAKRFGISTLTYYAWRKKAGAPARRGRPPSRPAGSGPADGNLETELRAQVRSQISALMPQIVREEVEGYFRRNH